MENIDKFILRFYIALFSSILFHCIFLLFLFIVFPDFKPERKTIPFQLVSNDRQGQKSISSEISRAQNALAAQEFLRTLNESKFEKLIRDNTSNSKSHNTAPSPFKSDTPPNDSSTKQPFLIPQKNNPNIFEGLQNIFNQKNNTPKTIHDTQQLSTKALSQLTEYERMLLQKLAQKDLYDKFHPVMNRHKQDNIDYIITLRLLSNGAIKSAQIKKSSSVNEIDNLALSSAYLASPFPKPPPEDISKDFKYDIPIIYRKK